MPDDAVIHQIDDQAHPAPRRAQRGEYTGAQQLQYQQQGRSCQNAPEHLLLLFGHAGRGLGPDGLKYQGKKGDHRQQPVDNPLLHSAFPFCLIPQRPGCAKKSALAKDATFGRSGVGWIAYR